MGLQQHEKKKTILHPRSCASAAKYSLHHDNHDDINLNTSISQCSTTGRRRKSSGLGGTLSARTARSETKELRSALQDREAAIQNLRIQLCLGKLPRPTGPPLDDAEKPAAELKLQKLKTEAENKKIKIKNLKIALEKLDITDNIDIRIRQAELEYALGREELQLLSVVEEARALQARLEKSKPELQTLYNILNAGISLSLHAVYATSGRWAAQIKTEQTGVFIDWALEGDGLYKGDRILEVNGKLVACQTKEELQKLVGNSGKCQMVVLRKKTAQIPQKQLDQEKENNMRLQHRISYLEEQVKELQTTKDQTFPQHIQNGNNNTGTNAHITSISISSPPSTPPEKPLVFQRGNYITTLVGGKPIELVGDNNIVSNTNSLPKPNSNTHITKTLIKENTHIDFNNRTPTHASNMPPKSLSASKISINSDSAYMQHYKKEKDRHRERYERSTSKTSALLQRAQMQAKSVEHLNHYNGFERRRDIPRSSDTLALRNRQPSDMRSVKSLDFESENETKPLNDTQVRTIRPTPPKKPLRLSLQRAQSLQTVELNANGELDRKRSLKRTHITDKASTEEGNSVLIENCTPLQTSSLGRQKHNI
ncbi:uncharacterized protein LOC119673977 [Teleopsis dalmanni]|uniref:uncharacterized protein LOC119673977 n=1 Tax=Teleopsis dalmanni TaxID=139649 RepID=UPI0018CD0140|nr:uncharacterized protein LOC119673977 [Teleopsis dalmanni]